MAAMLHFYPTLNDEIQKQYGVRLLGYVEGSTTVTFEGSFSATKNARTVFARQLENIVIDSVQLSCVQLVPSAIKRLGWQVLAFQLNLPSSDPTLQLCGCDVIQLEKAKKLLNSKPFENCVYFPTADGLSSDLNNKILDFQTTHKVAIAIQGNKIVITSYDKDSVHAARHDVEQLLSELTKQSLSLKCPQLHHLYLNTILLKIPTEEAKAFVASLPAKIDFKKGEILLTGTQQAIEQAEKTLLSSFLCDLQHKEYRFNCNTRFLSQIKQYVFTVLREQEKLDFVYTDDMPRKAEAKEFRIVIFSRVHNHFIQICKELEVSAMQHLS